MKITNWRLLLTYVSIEIVANTSIPKILPRTLWRLRAQIRYNLNLKDYTLSLLRGTSDMRRFLNRESPVGIYF